MEWQTYNESQDTEKSSEKECKTNTENDHVCVSDIIQSKANTIIG